MAAAFAFNGLLFGAWAARVPAFKDRFDLEPATLGLLLLALAGGAIAAFPLAGALSERWGPERLTVVCAAVYGPALAALALAPSALALGLCLAVFGAAHGAMDVAMNGWGARVEDRLARSTMSLFHAMFSLGAGLGAASGYAAAGLGFGPTPHFAAVAASAGGAALWAIAPQAPAQAARPARARPPLLSIPRGALALVGVIAFASSIGEGAMADWSAVYLRDVAAVAEAQAALGYAVFSVAMVAARLAGGAAVERFGPVAVTQASAATAAAGVCLAVAAPGLGPALAGFALMGLGYAVVMPLAFSRAARDPDLAPGPALAGVATLGYGGMLLGPPVIGVLAQLVGLRFAFLALAALAVLALVLAPQLRGPRR